MSLSACISIKPNKSNALLYACLPVIQWVEYHSLETCWLKMEGTFSGKHRKMYGGIRPHLLKIQTQIKSIWKAFNNIIDICDMLNLYSI